MTEPLELANRLRFITTLRESSIAGPLLGYNEIEALIEAAALIECQSVRPTQDGFNAGIEAAAEAIVRQPAAVFTADDMLVGATNRAWIAKAIRALKREG